MAPKKASQAAGSGGYDNDNDVVEQPTIEDGAEGQPSDTDDEEQLIQLVKQLSMEELSQQSEAFTLQMKQFEKKLNIVKEQQTLLKRLAKDEVEKQKKLEKQEQEKVKTQAKKAGTLKVVITLPSGKKVTMKVKRSKTLGNIRRKMLEKTDEFKGYKKLEDIALTMNGKNLLSHPRVYIYNTELGGEETMTAMWASNFQATNPTTSSSSVTPPEQPEQENHENADDEETEEEDGETDVETS